MCNTSRDIIRYFSVVASEDPVIQSPNLRLVSALHSVINVENCTRIYAYSYYFILNATISKLLVKIKNISKNKTDWKVIHNNLKTLKYLFAKFPAEAQCLLELTNSYTNHFREAKKIGCFPIDMNSQHVKAQIRVKIYVPNMEHNTLTDSWPLIIVQFRLFLFSVRY